MLAHKSPSKGSAYFSKHRFPDDFNIFVLPFPCTVLAARFPLIPIFVQILQRIYINDVAIWYLNKITHRYNPLLPQGGGTYSGIGSSGIPSLPRAY